MNKPRRIALRIGVATGIPAILTAAYGLPVVIYAGVTTHHRWDQFWTSAATPYGAATAGFGAIAAGALTYWNGQKQRHQDRAALEHTVANDDRQHDGDLVRDLRARFSSAAEQLAHETTTIQQAGAYAIASLADDWLQRNNTQEAQVCIDVLCTYLRTHHRTGEADPDYDYAQAPRDQAVRDTIIRIISSHLRGSLTPKTGAELPKLDWCGLDLDFEGAHLHRASFLNCKFSASIRFDRAIFSGGVDFTGSVFDCDEASFRNVRIHDGAFRFITVTTARSTNLVFQEARFFATAIFMQSNLYGRSDFSNAEFHGGALFLICAFGSAEFRSAQFCGGNLANFGHSRFGTGSAVKARIARMRLEDGSSPIAESETSFRFVNFYETIEMVAFDGASFEGEYTDFERAKFSAEVVRFHNPQRWNNVRFDWTNASGVDDASKKPENVHPEDWPPSIQAYHAANEDVDPGL